MRRLRPLLLVLMACWLTLQAVAAWTMPLCAHAVPPISAPCEHTGAHASPHEADETSTATHPPACDHCGVCHLASSGFLLARQDGVLAMIGPDMLIARPVITPHSHIAEPPRHPPRHRA